MACVKSVMWHWCWPLWHQEDWKTGDSQDPTEHSLWLGLYLEARVPSAAQFPILGLFSSRGRWVLTGSIWGYKNTRMRRMNELSKDNYMFLLFKRCQLMTAHILVRIYVLHGCSHSIADKVYFSPLRIPGQLDSAGNWWRVHGLCDIFFPKNKSVLKGH